MSEQNCTVCDITLRMAWADHHGIAQCTTCGAPYEVYHYDDARNRIDGPPSLLPFTPEVVQTLRRFYTETKAKLSAVGLGLSFPGGSDVAYESDIEAWKQWRAANPDAVIR